VSAGFIPAALNYSTTCTTQWCALSALRMWIKPL
jgi:hypothetical protein